MKSKIFRISQAPPSGADSAAPAPSPSPEPAMGDLGLGGAPSPMGGLPMGGGMGDPSAAQQTSSVMPKKMPYPLENVGMIFMDVNITKLLSEKLSNTSHLNTHGEEEIANEIWIMYGGTKDGGVFPGRTGERKEKQEVDEQEIERTDKTRWKRLPEGKNLLDLGITLNNMVESVKAVSIRNSIDANKAKAASYKNLIKIARILDDIGFYKMADSLIK